MTTIREWKTVHDCAKRTLENERRVELDAESSLKRTDFDALRNVICEFQGGTLTLRGRVPSYHMKQVADAAVAKVDGIAVVDNQLDIIESSG